MKHPFTRIMMTLLNLSFITTIFILGACNNKKDAELRDPNSYYSETMKVGDHEIMVCDVSKIKTKTTFPLSKLVEDCEMIYPETNDATLLPELRRHAISDNYICVAGFNSPVKLFKRDGSYVCDIGKTGRGPGEYGATPYQIILNEKQNGVFLVPGYNVDRLLHYNLKGDFVGYIPLLYKSAKARVWIKGDTITVASLVFDEETPVVYQQTSDGKLIKKLPVVKHLIQKADFSNEIFSSNTDHFDFQIASSDTLYHYNEHQNRLEPKLVFASFEGKTGQVLRELPNHYFGICYIKKNEREFETYQVIIEKHTLKTSMLDLRNDYYGGITVPRIFNGWGTFSSSVPAIKVIENINEALKGNNTDINSKQKLEDILNRLSEGDNDVVFVGRLKQAER
jgi:hypothetical protein